MILLFTNESNEVRSTHYMPFDPIHGLGKTKEELENEGGIFVESIPEPDNVLGKNAVLKYENENLFYEYADRPLNNEEQIESLKAENQSLNTAVVELYEIVLGGI
ncbi:hypothetical protein A6395_13400 [Exiguobacterium sp. SH31]|uniref:hypothetical protein n=1 Tax=Exiguobacterium sp. SH31 TaxID=1843183 RepID=UPI0008CA28BB|nr:hypothetical protein [Exiguobacterium sp. SH31]OGX78212.1 hypothetical protein A6395_13400 [Exiguobacterium sp. SH31]